jgi:hypothetical protein
MLHSLWMYYRCPLLFTHLQTFFQIWAHELVPWLKEICDHCISLSFVNKTPSKFPLGRRRMSHIWKKIFTIALTKLKRKLKLIFWHFKDRSCSCYFERELLRQIKSQELSIMPSSKVHQNLSTKFCQKWCIFFWGFFDI